MGFFLLLAFSMHIVPLLFCLDYAPDKLFPVCNFLLSAADVRIVLLASSRLLLGVEQQFLLVCT